MTNKRGEAATAARPFMAALRLYLKVWDDRLRSPLRRGLRRTRALIGRLARGGRAQMTAARARRRSWLAFVETLDTGSASTLTAETDHLVLWPGDPAERSGSAAHPTVETSPPDALNPARIGQILAMAGAPASVRRAGAGLLAWRFHLRFGRRFPTTRLRELAGLLIAQLPGSSCEIFLGASGQTCLDVGTGAVLREHLRLEHCLPADLGGRGDRLPVALGLDAAGDPCTLDLAEVGALCLAIPDDEVRQAALRLILASLAQLPRRARLVLDPHLAALDVRPARRLTAPPSPLLRERLVREVHATLLDRSDAGLEFAGAGELRDAQVLVLDLGQPLDPALQSLLLEIIVLGPSRGIFCVLGLPTRDPVDKVLTALRCRVISDPTLLPRRGFAAALDWTPREVRDLWLVRGSGALHLYLPVRVRARQWKQPNREPILGTRAQAWRDAALAPFQVDPSDPAYMARPARAARSLLRVTPTIVAALAGLWLGKLAVLALALGAGSVSSVRSWGAQDGAIGAFTEIDQKSLNVAGNGRQNAEPIYASLAEMAAEFDENALQEDYFGLTDTGETPFELLKAGDPSWQVKAMAARLPAQLGGSDLLPALGALGITPSAKTLLRAQIATSPENAAQMLFTRHGIVETVDFEALGDQTIARGCKVLRSRYQLAFTLKRAGGAEIDMPTTAYLAWAALADVEPCPVITSRLYDAQRFEHAVATIGFRPLGEDQDRYEVLMSASAFADLSARRCEADQPGFDIYLGALAGFYVLDFDKALHCAKVLETVRDPSGVLQDVGRFLQARILFWQVRFDHGNYRPDESAPARILTAPAHYEASEGPQPACDGADGDTLEICLARVVTRRGGDGAGAAAAALVKIDAIVQALGAHSAVGVNELAEYRDALRDTGDSRP